METIQLAEALDEIAEAFDPYEYRDNVEMGENTVQEIMLDLQSGNIHYYVFYLKDAEKGDKMLHHFHGKIDIGSGNGGIISQLKMQNRVLPYLQSFCSLEEKGLKERREQQGKDKPERGADLGGRTV